MQIGDTEINVKDIIAVSKVNENKEYYYRDKFSIFFGSGATVEVMQQKDSYIFLSRKDYLAISTSENLHELRNKIINLINDKAN